MRMGMRVMDRGAKEIISGTKRSDKVYREQKAIEKRRKECRPPREKVAVGEWIVMDSSSEQGSVAESYENEYDQDGFAFANRPY